MIKLLNDIAKAKGKEKVTMLKKHVDDILLKEIWHFAYGRIKFNTSVIVDVTIGSESNPKNFGKVIWLVDQLRCKVVTGNAAKVLISDTLSTLHPECIELYNRIIKGNLKCGIGVAAGNAVWGNNFIKSFPVMLIAAHCNKKAMKILQSKSGAVMQLKSDGVRGITIGDLTQEGAIRYYSRQGEEFLGLGGVFDPVIQSLMRSLSLIDGGEEGFSIDGEFVCFNKDGSHNFSKASGILGKCILGLATPEELDELYYVVWDLMLESDDDTVIYETRFYDLAAELEDEFGNCLGGRIVAVPTWKVTTIEEVHEKFREIVKTGNEGVVLKSLDNIWADKRVNDCIKYKEKHQAEFKIVGWYKGESGNEMQNVLGGFYIESACGLVISKTGSGQSFSDRGILMELQGKKEVAIKDSDGYYVADPEVNLDECINGICTIEYNARTKEKNGRETYSLRFPIFKGKRIDKVEADTLETMIQMETSSYGLRT